jgi:hypothetical protein
MNAAIDMLVSASQGQDLSQNPPYVILATDGQPNEACVGGGGGDGTAQRAGVLAEVQRAWQMGITTFVISLAGADAALQMHLDEVARHGNPADPAAHTFTPTNPEELVSILGTVLGSALGCNVL